MISKEEIRRLAAIEFITLFLYIVLSLTALWWWDTRGAVSIFIGGTLALLNFDLLKRIMLRIFEGPGETKMLFGALYGMKFIALTAALFYIVVRVRVKPEGVAVGTSMILIAITIYALWRMIWSIRHPEEEEDVAPADSYDDDESWPPMS